ncbi:MAG: ABC transporter substrate-binding protein [Sphaerochaetaceae bacterium]|nr:ABC transporter substrate-binding protein [Sphaerochaetaceae bacterium]
MKKSHIALILVCLALVCVAPAFGQGAKDSAARSEARATRTVVDHLGNEVTIPAEINRIIISSVFPLPSVYCLFEGDASKLVGMHPSSMAAAKNSILPAIMPDIVNVNTDFISGSEVNIEEVLKLKPDVAFYNASSTAEGEKYRRAGIPAVAFSVSKWNFNSIETFNGWVELLGEVLQKEDQAAGIVEYGKEVYDMIQGRLTAATDMEKPKALILFRYHNGKINTAGGTHFGQYWIDSTGGVNVASSLKGIPETNMEQIYQWNPDIIYITNFIGYLPEDLYGNVIEGHDWSHVKAVQEGKVYKFPLGMYRWYPPSSDTPLVLMWLAKHNQPDLFADIDMEQEVRDYYMRFYNMELSDDQVFQIFHPSRDAADE